jgi:iron complex outermembrane receptor protein
MIRPRLRSLPARKPVQNYSIRHAVTRALYGSHCRSLAGCSIAVMGVVAGDVAFALDEPLQQLQEVVVTARKRAELSRDVPVSLTALKSSALQDAGIANLTDLFAKVPGVENNADGSRIAQKPSIRGVGSRENASIRAKVTSFIDGVPVLGTQGIGSFAGLDRVEILRGPQSATFGRSTFGGAINYVTRDPGDAVEMEFRARLADHETRQLSAVVGMPVAADRLRFLLTLEERNYGGDSHWKTTSGVQLGAQNDKLATLKLSFNPGGTVRGSLMYMYEKVDDSEPPALFASLAQQVPHPLNPTGRCAINGGSASCVIVGAVQTVPLVFDYDYNNAANPVLNPGTRIERERLQGSLSADVGAGYSLTAVVAHNTEDSDSWFDRDTFRSSAMGTIHAASTPVMNDNYGELRLQSPDEGRLDWTVGASIYDYDYVNTVYTNLTANIVMDLFAESAKNTGVFASLKYQLSDRITGSLEGRYQRDKISGSYPANAARGAPAAIDRESTTSSFLPRLSLIYALDDLNNVYLQAARGNNPAGFNVNALDPTLQRTAASQGYNLSGYVTFQEEIIWNYELGLKGVSVDRKLDYSAAVYYLDWKGYVTPVTGNWTPANGVLLAGTTANDYFSRLFVNTGDLSGVGVEFEGSWKPTDRLAVTGALSYSGLKYTNDSCSPIPIDYGVNAIRTSPFACASVGGNELPLVSRFTTALSATYTRPMNAGRDAYARIDHSYRSKRFTEETNLDYLPSFNTVDLHLGVRADKWSAEIYGNNVLSDDTPVGAVRFFDSRQAGMVFNTTYQPRRPRSIGLSLEYKY